jgi:hypothetical protein
VRATDPRPDPAAPAAPAPAVAAAPAPAPRDHGTDPLAVRVAAGVLVSAFAVGLALVEGFLVPLRIGTVPLPICVLLAVAGNVVLTKLAVRQTGSIVCGVLQPVLWLVVIVVLSVPRAEGDLIVPGSATGLVFLFAGAVAGAYGVASEITRRAGAAGRTRQ